MEAKYKRVLLKISGEALAGEDVYKRQVQTLSKSRSLAGARVGLAISNKEIIEDLNRIKFSFNPYNLNRLSILAGTEALKDVEYFNDTRTWIIKTRETFVAQMEALGFTDVYKRQSQSSARLPVS